MLKSIISNICLIAIFCFLTKPLYPQDIGEVTMQLQIVNPTTFEVSLYLQRLGPTPWNLGIASFVFHFNNNALANPVEYQEGIWDNNTNSDYGDQINSYFGPSPYQYYSIDITYGSGVGTLVPTTPELLGKIRFTITNPGANAQIVWDDGTLLYSGITNTALEDITSQIVFTNPPEIPLPITLHSFTSSVNKNNINLRWETSKEVNNKEFVVERRIMNTENWKNTATIEGKGNTNNVTEYIYTDKNLQAGKYNYRLKQVDYNGNFEYFDLNGAVEVGIPDKFELSQNYPNPFNPMTKIDYQVPLDSRVEIRMYDATGREVKTILNEYVKAGYYTYELNANGLASGVYFYRIIASNKTNNYSKTLKLMLIK